MLSPSPITERRLELLELLRKDPSLLRLEPGRLRFSLGTSLADVRVPFHVADDAGQILPNAARQLVLMLAQRHKSVLPRDLYEPMLLDDTWGRMPEVPQKLAPHAGGPDVKWIAQVAARSHPALTGGVMAAWLGPGGGGRSLVALLLVTLRRAFAEMREARGREATPALVALMLSSLLPRCEQTIRAVRLGPQERWLQTAASTGVFLACWAGTRIAVRDSNSTGELAARVEAPLGPLSLWGARQYHLLAASQLYGCELGAGLPEVDTLVAALGGGQPVAEVIEEIAHWLAGAKERSAKAEQAVGAAALREQLVRAASSGEVEMFNLPLTEMLRDLAVQPPLFTGLLTDEKTRRQLARDVAAEADRQQTGAKAVLAALAAALKGYSPKDPASGAGLSRDQARAAYARAAVGYLTELWLERALTPARRVLMLRTGAEAEGGVQGEYDAGRLYRLSTRDEPILKLAVQPHVGHLFVDMKDFTRRTSLLGQATMAEFLRREFYLPILRAAKERASGLTLLGDRGGVGLNNLLGDAVSLSGEVEALVLVARDLRRHLGQYERALARAVSSDAVSGALRTIEESFAARLEAAPSAAARSRIEAERATAMARARGEGLEAGVFVSYGPAPLVVTMEDDYFGPSKVAIADRINESARGTARSGSARALADALLEAERTRRGEPSLRHAFSVFVDAPLSLAMPAAAELFARAALARGDVARAERELLPYLRETLEAAAAKTAPPGDIYNAGIALSEEALVGYQEAVGSRRTVRDLTLRPDALHPAIRERYFFPPGELRLVVLYASSGAVSEIFRYAGRVMFKGLERSGGIAVWELLDETGVGALLAEHHGARWLGAAG